MRFLKTLLSLIFISATPLIGWAEPATEPVRGELLVAAAAMPDPRFHHSVVLVLRHDETGAFGIVINQPLGERPLSMFVGEGAKDDSLKKAPADPLIPVFLGGPVEPRYGFVVHSDEYRRPETLVLEHGLAMTGTAEILHDIAGHHGPAKYLLAVGYAGWGPGQLETEIARHEWFTVPADASLVFDEARDAVWDRAMARRTREL